jgi:hypothetical protein
MVFSSKEFRDLAFDKSEAIHFTRILASHGRKKPKFTLRIPSQKALTARQLTQ